ncbi:MAG: hypothetical protein KGJ66_15780 [Alphaproteobacteria bacterium]|nr:hypothetical protein [Alphaproteobacteria bacterium]
MKHPLLAVFAGVVIVAVAGAVIYSRMQSPPVAGFASDQDKDAFIASAKQSCIAQEVNDPSMKQSGYTEAQIGLYCQCAAEKAADAITPEEVQYIATNRKIPASFTAKTQAIAKTCRSVTLPAPGH